MQFWRKKGRKSWNVSLEVCLELGLHDVLVVIRYFVQICLGSGVLNVFAVCFPLAGTPLARATNLKMSRMAAGRVSWGQNHHTLHLNETVLQCITYIYFSI